MDISGLGCVGTVSAVNLARVGHRVVGVNIDQRKVRKVAQGVFPLIEPGVRRTCDWRLTLAQ